MKHSIDPILKSLGLAPTSQKIYKALLGKGEVSARFLSETLSITRPSTYDHLHILMKKGLVVEKKKGTTSYFMVDDVRHIKQSLETSIENLKEQKSIFEMMLPGLTSLDKTESPRITFYEGKEGLVRILNDVLWSKGEVVSSLWPHEEMLQVLDEETLLRFNKRRVQEKIQIRSLWPHSKNKAHGTIWGKDDILVTRKMVPKDFTYSMGYTIYGDKVSFISSHNEIFGFIVQSKDFSNLMRAQFDMLWRLSK